MNHLIQKILLAFSSATYLNQPKISLHEFLRNIDSPHTQQHICITKRDKSSIVGIIESKTQRTYTISQEYGSEIIRILEIHAIDQLATHGN